MLLVTVLGGTWCLEQPGTSCLEFYPAFRDFLTALWEAEGRDAVPLLKKMKRVFFISQKNRNESWGRKNKVKAFMLIIKLFIFFLWLYIPSRTTSQNELPPWLLASTTRRLRFTALHGGWATTWPGRQSGITGTATARTFTSWTRGNWLGGRRGIKTWKLKQQSNTVTRKEPWDIKAQNIYGERRYLSFLVFKVKRLPTCWYIQKGSKRWNAINSFLTQLYIYIQKVKCIYSIYNFYIIYILWLELLQYIPGLGLAGKSRQGKHTIYNCNSACINLFQIYMKKILPTSFLMEWTSFL